MRLTTLTSIGVSLEEKKKLQKWYTNSKVQIPFEEMSALFLVAAVLARIDEVYGPEGIDRVEAAIKFYLDDQDVLTVLLQLNEPLDSSSNARSVALRVQRAIMNETLREKEEAEAMKIVQDAIEKEKDDDEIVVAQCQGGGKCTFELGRTKRSLREEGGGSTETETKDYVLNNARETVLRGQIRRSFPPSLW